MPPGSSLSARRVVYFALTHRAPSASTERSQGMPRQLRSSDDELFELSDAAARQSLWLKDLPDGAVPVPLLDSGRLQRITELLEQTAAAFGLESMADQRRDALLKDGLPRGDIGTQLRFATATALEGVADFATRLFDLKWFDAPLPISILAEGVAQLLSGKSADALRTLLVADDDLGDQEKEAALLEPLSWPPSAAVPDAAAPPPLAGSVLLAMDGGADDEGNMMACLKRCDPLTLRQLKAVSAGWQQRARHALFDRLCSRQGPRPERLDDVEELDVEELQHVGRHELVAAVRQMPNLARLRGYGFTVELQAVRQAEGGVDDNDDGADDAPSAVRPCAAASRARVSHHTSCCSQLWPARRVGRCAGFPCSGCGRTIWLMERRVACTYLALASSQ